MPEWTADWTIDEFLAKRLIDRQFHTLRPAHVALFGAGWDNNAYLINDRYVFRYPRRAFAVACMQNEIKLLPMISARLPLVIPAPKFVGEPSDEFPYPFAGYELIPGLTADRAALTDEQRIAAAPALGRFLKELHSADLAGVDLPGDTIRRMDIRHRADKGRERLRYALKNRLLPKPDLFQRIFTDAPLSYVPQTNSLVHGDLYSRHLIVDSTGHLTGVIDWGDAHRGDAATDLMILFTLFPAQARASFLDSYGGASEESLTAARFRAAYHTIQLIAFAHDTNDVVLLGESQRAAANICDG